MIISYKGNYKNGIKSGKWEYFNDQGVTDTIINYNEKRRVLMAMSGGIDSTMALFYYIIKDMRLLVLQ